MSKSNALFPLGMDLDSQHTDQRPGTAQTEEQTIATSRPEALARPANDEPGLSTSGERLDHFAIRNGVHCAGVHLVIDLYEANRLDDLALMEATLRDCVAASGATLLHLHLHHFSPNDGISGVAVLAESHICVHTWPEANYAAFDVFMCGDAMPEACVDVIRNAFTAKRIAVSEHLRGRAT